MHLSFVLCLIYSVSHLSQLYPSSYLFHVTSIPYLIYSASYFCLISYLFCVLSLDRTSTLRSLKFYLKFQIMSQLQTMSRNHSCMTKTEIGDNWKNKMYIERVANPVFYYVSHFNYHLSDPLHNFIHLMKFSLYLLTGYRIRKTLTCTCALPANTIIFELNLGPF